MTILELLEWGNSKLKKHQDIDKFSGDKLDSPILDAEVLLAFALNQPKHYIFSHLNDTVLDQKIDTYQKIIKRRLQHEPVAYITGKKSFYGRDFFVNQYVLIPRPETEILIEEAISLSKKLNGETWFADVGIGSGAIAVTLAAETKNPVIASDISDRVIAVAKKNAITHGVKNLIDLSIGDGLDPVVKIFKSLAKSGENYPENLIICANLPYLTTAQWENAQQEITDWEPKEALDGGTDGLDVYWAFFRQLAHAKEYLPKTIYVLIEIDPSQTEDIKKLIKHYFPHGKQIIKKDLQGLDRVVITKIR